MIYTLEGVSQSYDILHELKKFKGHFLKVEKAHTYSYVLYHGDFESF